MNSRSQIRCYKPAFVLQRYFCTFVANPSDSISDVVIQMHFLSLYKGRICVYSTRTDFKRNSYTNSYTKIRWHHKETATEALLLRFLCGATGNRTRDTRIFSPLLYQLSYGTRFCLELPFLSIGIAKVGIFS